jgi:uncharacterized protein
MALQSIDPRTGTRVPPNLCALGIMTKAPQPGKVKTRLTPPLTSEEAAHLNTCFLRDLSHSISFACSQSPARGVGIYTPLGSESVYENILPQDFLLIAQREGNFGQRLAFAVEDLFKAGFESVCLINSDSPTVPAASFAEAAIELANPGDRIVLGPSEDGGYYLIGMKKLHRRVFEEIDWSTQHVFEQTKERATEVGIRVYELALGLDVDDRTTLAQLCADLFGPNERSTSDLATNTREFLSKIIEREGRERIWPK